jgi:hypothetical protein
MRRQRKRSGRGGILLKAAGVVLALIVVGAVILSIVDIAGDTVAEFAGKAIREQTGMRLSVREVHGNPIRGYTFSDVALASDREERLFSAKSLGVGVNFMSLPGGSPRLSILTIGGVDMDLDRFVTEFNKIKFPESGGGGEVPIDRISLRESRFTSKWGQIVVDDIGARLRGAQMDVTLAGAVNGVPVKGAFDLDMQGGSFSVNKADIGVGRGRLISSGYVRPAGETETDSIDFQGSLRGIDLAEITAFWPESLASPDYSGTADVDFSIEGSSDNLLISAAPAYRGTKVGGYPLESLSANLKYADMRLTVSDLKATSLGVPIDGSIAVAMKTGSVPSIMVKLDGGNAPLSELARLYPGLGRVGGKVERFAANIQGPTNELSGTIELSAPDIVLMGRRVTGLAAQVKLAKSSTATVNGKFVLEGAQGYLQGTVTQILTGAGLNLTLKLLNLDVKKVEDLIPDGKRYALSGAVTADLAIKGRATSPAVSGTIGSPKFSAAGYTLDNPSVTFVWDKDVLTLTNSGGAWSGLPITMKGSVGPLSSKTPPIDMTAQIAFKPDNLKQFVPDVASYKLQGDINAGVKITGKLPSPKIDLVASSPSLSAFGTVSAKNIEVTTAVAGDLSKLEKIDVNLKAGSVAAVGAGLQNLVATIRKDGPQIRLENVSAKSGEGSITGGGTITSGAGGAMNLNLAFDVARLDLAPLAKSGGLGVALSGLVSGKVGVTGASSNPSISLTAQSPNIAVEGLSVTDLAADVSGNANALKINGFRANAGGAPLSATGSVILSDPFRADLDLAGDGLDLAALTAGLPGMKGQFSGKADLKFNVKSTAQGNSGTGSIRSASVTAFGLKLSGVSLPLALSGSVFRSANGTLDFYGGKVTNSLTFDMSSMKFSDSLTANGFDVNAAAQDASGGLGGKIAGRGNLSMKIDGSAAKDLTYSGSGQFTMGEGGITGFSGLDPLTKLYGSNGIRYTKVTAPLRLETNRLVIGKGASAVPPANDPIYKSASLAEDGSFTFDKKLYFVADMNVNFQLVNALSGGAIGGAEALVKGGSVQDILRGKNLESALKGALGGAKESSKNADFRDVTAKITGTAGKPSVALVKVGPSTQTQGQGNAGETTAPAAPAATPSKPAKPEEVIKEKIMDAIAPRNNQPETPSRETQSQPDQKQQQQEQLEKQIRKGIDSIFRKK